MGQITVKRGVGSRYNEMVIFTYSIGHMLNKSKIRFYYALKGRDGKAGIVKDCDIVQLGKAVLLVPKKYCSEMEEFLELWECNYKKREVLLKR